MMGWYYLQFSKCLDDAAHWVLSNSLQPNTSVIKMLLCANNQLELDSILICSDLPPESMIRGSTSILTSSERRPAVSRCCASDGARVVRRSSIHSSHLWAIYVFTSPPPPIQLQRYAGRGVQHKQHQFMSALNGNPLVFFKPYHSFFRDPYWLTATQCISFKPVMLVFCCMIILDRHHSTGGFITVPQSTSVLIILHSGCLPPLIQR